MELLFPKYKGITKLSNSTFSANKEAFRDNFVTELKIRGIKLANISGFNGHAIPGKTLSETFSIDSLVTTLTRLTSLRALSLVSLGIWGPLPDKIHRLYSLELLDLSSNFMFGSIPPQISRMVKLQTLTLDGNYFNGTIPDTLDSLSNLTVLSLRGNRLKGQFPSSICRISSLTDIALCHNKLSGKLPDLSSLTRLRLLDIRENQFDSELPVMPQGLVTALLAENLFSGDIPAQFGHLTCGCKLGFVDISGNKLVGGLPFCLDNKSDKRVVKYGGNCLSTDGQQQHQGSYCNEASTRRSGRKIALLVAVVVSALFFMLLAFGIIILFRRCRPRRTFETHIRQKAVHQNPTTGVSPEVLANDRFISEVVKLGGKGAPVCRLFTMEELEEATNNFDSSMFMGEGSTGKLYKGRLENGTYAAIRSLSLLKKHSIQNLKVKLDFLSKIHHPHLVGLLGHYIDGETCPEKVLKWSDRLAILMDVAKAVHFLHTGVIPGVYNNRLKTNNILLDEHRIAKLKNDKHFIALQSKGDGLKSSQRQNLEDDVYNFGFILLESLVGPIVSGKGETFLLNEMASFGSQDGRKRIVDPTVLTTCSQESLSIVVSMTGKCICPEPSSRPSFADVLWNLQYAAQIRRQPTLIRNPILHRSQCI
ncbi:putative amine oxidase [Hibiscus syriacus]|uniref:Amine oxidase n=1 Tax=Hibiscus syriacus TaxID=106335 RepID=A0A6A3AUX5_HIBSY|nr:putative amine oxidase [Hibiscus syriacus]